MDQLFIQLMMEIILTVIQGRPQAGVRWFNCSPLDFTFKAFSEYYPCPVSDTETPSDSFLQSEILQQVLVFHK